jgi:hypothetical protein
VMAKHLAARRSTAAFADSIRSFISPFDDWEFPSSGRLSSATHLLMLRRAASVPDPAIAPCQSSSVWNSRILVPTAKEVHSVQRSCAPNRIAASEYGLDYLNSSGLLENLGLREKRRSHS